MKKERWYEDQPILKTDMAREQTAKEAAISERLLDAVNFGTLLESQLLGETSALLIQQGPNAGLYVTVNTGVAYSPIGERIIVSTVSSFNSAAPSAVTDNGIGGTVLTPRSTGSQNVPLTDNATNRIWLGYLETTDTSTFTLSHITNERLFIKKEDGFEIRVTTTSINPDSSRFVLIGEAVTLGGVVTSISSDNTREAQSVGPVAIPGSPYQIALTLFPNLPTELDRPASIPTVTGFVYTPGIPAAGEFTVNFQTGIVTFNAADTTTSVTINYLAQYTRRPLCVSKEYRAGGNISPQALPATYAAGSTTTFTDHINARGSGVITPSNPHGTAAADIGLAGVLDLGGKLASSGIIIEGGNASSIVSSLSPSAVSAFAIPANLVTIAPLVAGETLNVNGTLITSTDIPSLVTFNFIDSLTLLPLSAGTYSFYVDISTKTIEMISGASPSNSFAIASIYWDGSKLQLPITDLRVFGTTGKTNLRLETLLALAAGAATDNRLTTIYNAKLTGSVVVTPPTYAFVGLGGTTLNITVNGVVSAVTFPAFPINTTISGAVAAINAQIPSLKAVKTPTNQIKLLAYTSLTIIGGAAAPILGFVAGQTDNEAGSFVVTGSNNKIDFKVSAGPQLTATLTTGTYVMGSSSADPGTLCEQIKLKMQAADVAGIYAIAFNTVTRKVTIARNAATFQILWLTGTNTATAAKTLLGFTNVDTPVAISITSDSTTAAPSYIATNQNIKEIRISGSSSSIGVGGEVIDAEVAFVYDQTALSNLVQVVARMGNSTQTTLLTYNVDSTLRTIQEIVG
jgi:hypothetical protein